MAEAKITFRCPRCESSQVVRDAYAEWDDDAQEWVLQSTYDSFACNECGADFREPDEIELDDETPPEEEPVDQLGKDIFGD